MVAQNREFTVCPQCFGFALEEIGEGGECLQCGYEFAEPLVLIPKSSPAAETAERTAAPEMGKGWRVEVSRFGDQVVAIEERMLTGKPDITEADRQLIVGCAEHLRAFAGDGKSMFIPDDDSVSPSRAETPDPLLECDQCGAKPSQWGEEWAGWTRTHGEGSHCPMDKIQGCDGLMRPVPASASPALWEQIEKLPVFQVNTSRGMYQKLEPMVKLSDVLALLSAAPAQGTTKEQPDGN